MNLSQEIRLLLSSGQALTVAKILAGVGPAIAAEDAEATCIRLQKGGHVRGDLTPEQRIEVGKRRLVQESANRLVNSGTAVADGRGDQRQFRLNTEGGVVVGKDIREVKIDDLSELVTQVRVGLDEQTVEEYAEAMRDGDEFPPIVAFDDGATLWLGGGFHRVEARRRNGHATVMADVRKGTRQDAVRFGVGDNAKHGLRMTGEDKERAVRLFRQEFPKASVNEIAQACRVSWSFTDKVLNPKQYQDDGRTKKPKDDVPAREPDGEKGDAWEPPANEPPAREPTKEKAPAKKPETKAEPPVRDSKGKVVPSHLRDAFGSSWHQDTIDTLGRIATQVESVMKHNAFLEPEILEDLARVQDRIVASRPFVICPRCKGTESGCAVCRTAGFIPENIEKNLD